jgi:hypothetical protein
MRGWLRGCAVALLLMLGVCGWAFWRIGEPSRRASLARAQIRTGMTPREVFAVSGHWWRAWGSDCGGAGEPLTSYAVNGAGDAGQLVLTRRKPGAAPDATALDQFDLEQKRYASRDELVKLIEETQALSSCKQVGFNYLVPGVPPRVSFSVFFEGGKVTRLSEPRTWD